MRQGVVGLPRVTVKEADSFDSRPVVSTHANATRSPTLLTIVPGTSLVHFGGEA